MSCGEALVDLVPDPRVGGGPLNVAVAAARLGAPTAFLGRLSSDVHGRAIRDHLERSGVDLRLIEVGPEPTLQAVVELGPPVSYRFVGEGTADERREHADLAPIGPGPHVLHGSALGLFRGRTATVLADLMEQHDGLVSLDPNPRPFAITDRDRWDHFHHRWRARCDLYRVTEEDLDFIEPGRRVDSLAGELLDTMRCRAVLVGRADASSTVFHRDGIVEIAMAPTEVVDTVGAGDSFMGAVLAQLADRHTENETELARLGDPDWFAIGAYAALAASITCSRLGADPPTSAEVDTRRSAS